jgi:3-carboxy-cis,cis-muconate cycloisomerase
MRHIISGLQVHADRMRTNIDTSGGLLYAEAVGSALAQRIGRTAAHSLVERACRRAVEGSRDLCEIVANDAEIASVLSTAEINELFDPQRHVSAAARLVEKSLVASMRPMSSSPAENV